MPLRSFLSLAGALLLVISPVRAQTTHTVDVANFQFTPATLTINQGDTVVFENTAGMHNADGSLATYPSNPEGFRSGDVSSAPWTFSFTFTIPGDYQYQCNAHAPEMAGSITVLNTTSTENEVPAGPALGSAYPNPFRTSTSFTVTTTQTEHIRVVVYDAAGRQIAVVLDEAVAAGIPRRVEWMPTEAPAGAYFYRVEGADVQTIRKVILVR